MRILRGAMAFLTGDGVHDARQLRLIYSYILLIVLLPVLLISGCNALGEAAEGTLTPWSYMPVVHHTGPTPTPMPTSTPRPPFQDGHYYVDLTGDVGGYISFHVRNGGAIAYDAEFLYYWATVPNPCTDSHSWTGQSMPIIDGFFNFFHQGNDFVASMSCESLSTASSECLVSKMPADPGCPESVWAIVPLVP